MQIKKATKDDLKGIAQIGSENFSGIKDIKDAQRWVECNFSASPRMQYFVAKENEKILGYILWMEKGGFRKESVWELEQIAVGKDHQGNGVGTQLIKESLEKIKKYAEERGAVLKLIEVSTGTDNKAQGLYKKILGAEVECAIKNFFRGDEVIMIARFDR